MAITSLPDMTTDRSALTAQVGGDHYKAMKIQPAEYIHANNIGFLEGNAIKYVSRWKTKGGKADLLKAIHCIQLELEESADNVAKSPKS
jgi:hypothetical protein